MSLKANHFAQHATTVGGFPAAGGPGGNKKTGTKKTKTRKKKALSARQKAEAARADDPYGNHGASETRRRGDGRVRRRRVKVRRRRVSTGQAKPNYGTSKAQQAKNANKSGKAQLAQQNTGPSNQHMMRSFNAQSSLNRMTAGFRGAQAGRPQGPQTPMGKKMAMLGNLQCYMKNDYACMKANDQDTAFTYRTSEARQLYATLGTMVASATKQGQKKDTKSSDDKPQLSSKAFTRKKGLLKKLKAMSDPTGPMPEGLPVDYKPFDNVA